MMRERPGEGQSVADRAEEAGVSAAHFSRMFKKVVGVSPQYYAMEARVDQARQMLMESEMKVGQIAAALGYRDVFFFSRQFKQVTGKTPGAYRGR